ncbi:trypsin-like peptidase domain-containing protein [Streptomyces avicenniae]|uniref:VMAP-C domain-containing protein n=1 Tax=Streptomyces avicenniae TaxID=500153 RepID=UPI00069B7960|nr:trypsin-like peptidase domain-containing protein [Streptomyces avicenniae]
MTTTDPFEYLAPLAEAATVRIQSPPGGYAAGTREALPWGSGFFVAPGWVLTCAHVALYEGGAEGGVREVGLTFGDLERPVRGRVEWAQPHEPGPDGSWDAPDLALVRLLDPVEHDCVWLTERTARVFTSKEVAFFGCADTRATGRVEPVSGRCTIRGEMGGGGLMKLGDEDEIPHGLSGGPVVDLERGEVIGVLKARRPRRDGGLATSVIRLRGVPLPDGPVTAERDDLYQRVLHAHDRHHAGRHRDADAPDVTWTDAQSRLPATADRALSPGSRAELLGLLAELPPPVSTAALDRIVSAMLHPEAHDIPHDRRYKKPLPAPRGWRDGLGMLYDPGQGLNELQALLRYAVHAATADRPYPAAAGAEEALTAWAHATASGSPELSRWFRATLRSEQSTRLRARAARGEPGVLPPPRTPHYASALADGAAGLDILLDGGGAGPGSDLLYPVTALAPAPPRPRAAVPEAYTLLEITPNPWEFGSYDWRVCAARINGELIPVDEECGAAGPGEPSERLRGALAEAFRRGDEPERPVRLQVALPYSLLGFPVDAWRLVPGGPTLGEQRPVVVRSTDLVPEAEDSDESAELRRFRWDRLHAGPVDAGVLDCADGLPRPLTTPAALSGLDVGTLPVLCRTPTTGGEPGALHRVMAGGYNVILWRRDFPDRDQDCDGFHGGVVRAVSGAGHAGALPGELRSLRAASAAGGPEADWSRGLALLYADPDQNLPGVGDPLETP